jgi:putative transposase
VDKSWKAFFRTIKEWKIHPKNYKGKPNPPYFKKKEGHFILIFTNQNCKIENNTVILTMARNFKKKYSTFATNVELKIPAYKGKMFDMFQQIRILPRRKFFEIEIIYLQDSINHELEATSYLSIDLGIDNLATLIENKNIPPLIISGKILKSVNQYWNKQKARLYSVKDKQKIKWTVQLDDITSTRNSFVNDYLHKVSCFIIAYCVEHGIGTICFGELKHIKDNVQLGKRNNQNFVNIPIQKLKQLIRYKAELVRMKIIEVNEEYTSKCSSLDLESIEKHETYRGRRIKRGLFRGSNYLLNADVNGSLNILRKVIGDDFIRDLVDRGCWFRPIRIRSVTQTSYEQFLLKDVNAV